MRTALITSVLLAGCWTGARPQPTPAGTSTSSTTSVAPIDRSPRLEPAAHRELPKALPRHSVWQGSYYCSQGVTAVRFLLDVDGSGADAIFEFGPHPDNPRGVPEGSSHLRGSFSANTDGTYTVDVDPLEWINQPPTYYMVGVTATIDAQLAEMHGRMKADSCGRFDVVRVRN